MSYTQEAKILIVIRCFDLVYIISINIVMKGNMIFITLISRLCLLSNPTHSFPVVAYGTICSSIQWRLPPWRKVQICRNEIFRFQKQTPHVDVVAFIERAAVQRALVTSERVPCSMEVIGHDTYEV